MFVKKKKHGFFPVLILFSAGEKPYCCPECGKCLRRKFDLKKHILSHSNVRPYTCIFCSKSYTRQTHLNRHLLTHRAVDEQVMEVETTEET